MRKLSKFAWFVISMLVVIAIFNIAAFFTPFCDWYVEAVFPLWINGFGRVTSLVPFSVGEWMITLGVIYIAVVLAINVIAFIRRKNELFKLKKFSGRCNRILVTLLLIVCLILSLNWTMINRCSKIMETGKEFHISQLQKLRNSLVITCNTLAKEMERDGKGMLVYDKDRSEIQAEAEEALHRVSKMYPRLSGYYPDMKPMMYSGIMSQSSMLGYYFPFSMEANYNKMMYIVNYPQCFCHELSHIKGYMMEDEANFLAYLACISSDDLFFQYSGYLSVLYHVDNAFYMSAGKDYYLTQPPISKQVKEDNVLLTKDVKIQVEEKAIIKTETVKKASDKFNDVTIKMGGVADGLASYDRVTELLLLFYEEQLGE